MNDGFWLIAALGLLFVSQTQEPAVAEEDGGFISSGGGAPGPNVLAKILGGMGLNGVNGGDSVIGAPVGMIGDETTVDSTAGGAGTFWGALWDALGIGEVANGEVANGGAMGAGQGVYDPAYVELVDRGGGSYSVTGSPEELELLVADPSKGLILSGWGGPLGADINFPGGLDVLTQSLIQHGPPINGDDNGDDPDEIMYDPVFVDLVDRGGGSYSVTGGPEELELLVADPTRGVVVSGWGGPLGADVNFPGGLDVLTQSLIQHGLPINGDDS